MASGGEPDHEVLDVRTAPSDGGWTVTLVGDVDSASAPELRARLINVVGDPAGGPIELDLRGVTFLNAAGLRALAAVHGAAQRTGRPLRMRCGTNRAVIRPLQITGLSTAFTVVDA